MTASFLLIVQIVLVIILVIAVLLQKSSSIGLGAYSGSNDSVFGAKGPNSFLAKATFTIGFLFVVNTIALGYIYSSQKQASVVDDLVETTNVVAPTAQSVEIPTQEEVPAEKIQEQTPVTVETTPEAPVTPSQTK